MTQELGDKVDSTQESIKELRQGSSALFRSNSLLTITSLRNELKIMTESMLKVHQTFNIVWHEKLDMRPLKRAKIPLKEGVTAQTAAEILSSLNE